MSDFRLNSFRTDPNGWIGAGVMAAFGAFAVFRWKESGNLFFALLAFRDLSAAAILLARRRPINGLRADRSKTILAYVSSAVPFGYFGAGTDIAGTLVLAAEILGIVGFGLATVALFELGRSFGVTPANRGSVRSGVYRVFRHPMYVGYAVAELGQVLINPMNSVVFVFSMLLYGLRAKFEMTEFGTQSSLKI